MVNTSCNGFTWGYGERNTLAKSSAGEGNQIVASQIGLDHELMLLIGKNLGSEGTVIAGSQGKYLIQRMRTGAGEFVRRG